MKFSHQALAAAGLAVSFPSFFANAEDPNPACGEDGAAPSIADFACSAPAFSTLCTLVGLADLGGALSGPDGPLTTFAPTNFAFDALGQDTLDAVTDPANIDLLTEILLTHVATGAVGSGDLVCDGEIPMLSGEATTTKCDGDTVPAGQIGDGNTLVPAFLSVDIPACNGLVHVIDNVILPSSLAPAPAPTQAPAPPACGEDGAEPSIAGIACSDPTFSTLCSLVTSAGLDGALSGPGPLTTFTPTNDAFDALDQDTLDTVTDPANVDLLTTILLTHVTAGAVGSADLVCDGEITMLSGEETTTKCVGGTTPVAQLGDGNAQLGGGNTNEPQFVAVDIPACNGLVHVIDRVILPDAELPAPPADAPAVPPTDEPDSDSSSSKGAKKKKAKNAKKAKDSKKAKRV